MKAKTLGIFLFWGIILLICVTVLIIGIKGEKEIAQPKQTKKPIQVVLQVSAEEQKLLDNMLINGLIDKITWSLNEVFINPIIWAGLKYDEKENLCRFLAEYCGKKKGTGINWVEIKDAYSGKKLAKYDSWGFKVY